MTRVWLNTTEMSEDCLYLNIWTNAINGSLDNGSSWSRRSRLRRDPSFQQLNGRPVMVWIHGGNLVSGSASLEMYNGAILASEVSTDSSSPYMYKKFASNFTRQHYSLQHTVFRLLIANQKQHLACLSLSSVASCLSPLKGSLLYPCRWESWW